MRSRGCAWSMRRRQPHRRPAGGGREAGGAVGGGVAGGPTAGPPEADADRRATGREELGDLQAVAAEDADRRAEGAVAGDEAERRSADHATGSAAEAAVDLDHAA